MADGRPGSASNTGDIVPYGFEESTSGVGWKYMNEGCTLIFRSVREATSASQETELTRRLYVDGVAYFLRGLPTYLTEEETLRLSAALPPQLIGPADGAATVESTVLEQQKTIEATPTVRPTLVRLFVAKITVCIAHVVKFLLDCLRLVCQEAYRYDRRHRISVRALVNGALLLDCVWKEAMRLVNNVCALDDGRVGEALGELSRHIALEVSNGLYDGIGEAVGFRGDRQSGRLEDIDVGECYT